MFVYVTDEDEFYKYNGTAWEVYGQGVTNLSHTLTASNVTVESDTGTDTTIPAATTSDAGVMSSSDKTKLDGIETGATADQSDSEIETAYNNQVAQVSAGEKTAGTETGIRRFSPKDVADMAGDHDDPTNLSNTPSASTLDVESSTGTDTTLPAATTSLAGVMTGTDKTKLDGIESGATGDQTDAEIETGYNNQVDQVSAAEKTAGTELGIRRFSPDDVKDMIDTHATGTTNLSNTPAASTLDVESSSGTDTTLPAATTSLAGVMTGSDKTKLDGIETSATADQTDAEIETAYNNQVDVVSQAEAEAGTATTVRRWTAQRVAQAIAALETGEANVLPPDYFHDLEISRDVGDTDHDITISVGGCRDNDDDYDLVLTSALTKQIDATFAAGDDAGGMFTGSVAADTWYHIFLIRKDSDGSIDAGFDTSNKAVNIPSGYTAFRYVNSVLTDGSSNIIDFVQKGNEMFWLDPPQDFSTGSTGTTAVNRTVTTPAGFKFRWIGNARVIDLTGSFDTYLYLSDPDVNDEAPGTSAPFATVNRTEGINDDAGGLVEVHTNDSSQIRTRMSASNAALVLRAATLGWRIDRSRY